MPISSNPNATSPFWLDCDAEIPLDKRPVFLVRFMTTKQVDQHADLMRRAYEDPDPRRTAELLLEAVHIGIAGWKNFNDPDGKPIPFSDQAYFDALSDRERWQVAWNYPSAVRLSKVDLGFFGLGACNDSDSAASTIGGAATSTPTTR